MAKKKVMEKKVIVKKEVLQKDEPVTLVTEVNSTIDINKE